MPSTLVHNSVKKTFFFVFSFIWTSFVWVEKAFIVTYVHSFDVYYIIWCRIINPPFWPVLSLAVVVNFPENIQKLLWLFSCCYDDVNNSNSKAHIWEIGKNCIKIASAKLNEHWTLKSARIDRNNKRIQQMLHIIWRQKTMRKMMAKKNRITIKCIKTTNNAKIGAFVATDDIYLEHVTIINYLMHAELFGVCTLQNVCVSFLCVEYIGRKNDNSQHKQPMCSSSAVDNYKIWYLLKNEHQIKIIIKFCPDKRSCS